MPELPEVEVVRRSLSNFITAKNKKVRIFNNNLRYTLSKISKKTLKNKKSHLYQEELNIY